MWQELNREDTTTSLHYLLRAGQILITTKSLDKTSGTVQPFQTHRNTEHMCEDHRIFPSVLDSVPHFSTGTITEMMLHPQQKYIHWMWIKDLSWPEDPLLRLLSWEGVPSAVELTSPVLAAHWEYSMPITMSNKKILLFYLNFLFPLWSSSNSSLIQTCKRWLVFLKSVVCLWYSLMRKYRCKGILTFASFVFASLHINRIFNELV